MSHFTGPTHGGEVYALARKMRIAPDAILDFSSNTNIFAHDITAGLVKTVPYPFLHYPDSNAGALVSTLAIHENVEPEKILVGNGAAELIWLALQALAPRKVLCIGPIFSEYIAACHAFNIPYQIITPPAENDFCFTPENLEALWETDADLVVLCTPNNPAAVTYENIPSVLHMLRAPRVLIDNSYREFLFGSEAYQENSFTAYSRLIRPGVNLFTLNSFTKFFCCPGIRLGYLLGERTQLARLAAMRPSWTVSPFAQQMGIVFLSHIEEYRDTLALLRNAVSSMARDLRRLECLNPEHVVEGPGFLCCALAPRFNATSVCKALLNKLLLVRNCDTIPGMPSGYIRMQARPQADANVLLAALETIYIENM